MSIATRPRPQAHQRKRHAGHHRHTRRYLSPYRPYLPMLLIVGLGLLVNSVWSGGGVLGSSSDFSAASLLVDTNSERARLGVTALSLDPRLSAAAQAKAEDMVRSDYWAHDSPGGRTPWSFITASGYQYKSAGENLAYGFSNAGDSVAGWMNSAEHRANILNKSYSDVGFGVASSPDFTGHGPETIVVAEYAQPASSAADGSPAEALNTPSAGAPAAANVLGAEQESRPVSRIQLLVGGEAAWSLMLVITVTAAAGALFVLRHGYKAHRWLTRGEQFVSQHPYYDIAIVFLITGGCVLTRVSGIVR